MTAIDQIKENIDNKRSFVLEAGAGSGKTYTLIQTLNFLLEKYGNILNFNHQRIVCITYTNVAKNEIIDRLEHNALVSVSTIHEFLWDSVKSFNKQLKQELVKLNEIRYSEELVKKAELTGAKLTSFEHKYIPNLSERIDNIIDVEYQDTAFRDFESGLLHHDDVIVISKMMFESNNLLTKILSQKYPFVLIDEYQDTATETAKGLIDFILGNNLGKIVLGFYGDSYQKIYDAGIGSLDEYISQDKLNLVKKEENYRSSKNVVSLLNKFRTNITQNPIRVENGSVRFIYCKNYIAKPSTGIIEWEKKIEPTKNANYDKVTQKLISDGWSFEENSPDKILVIANSRVAKRANFGNMYQIFSTRYGMRAKENLNDREHPVIKFFAGYIDKKTSQERQIGLEHLVNFWNDKDYNHVYHFIKRYSNIFNSRQFEHADKLKISKLLFDLNEKRENSTIGEVLKFVLENGIMIMPESFRKFIDRINSNIEEIEDEKQKSRIKKDKVLFDDFLALPYKELINFFYHIQNHTVFSTKHGTKGEEYRNVLTVIDDTEWKSEYNFETFFNDTDENERRKLKTRNLFYVECSRAKENLVVLALSGMDDKALNMAKNWFGNENVIEIEEFN